MAEPITLRPGEKTVILGERVAVPFPYLVIIDGPRRGRRFPLEEGSAVVGRAPGSHILLDDQSVSRRHCEVQRAGDQLTVQDLGSKNGTLVNQALAGESVRVGHGDLLQVGIYTLRVISREVAPEEELAPPPEPRPPLEEQPIESSAETAMLGDEVPGAEVAEEAVPAEGQQTIIGASTNPPGSRRRILLLLAIAVGLTAVGVGGFWAYHTYLAAPPESRLKMVSRRIPPPETASTTVPSTPPTPTDIPVIVDFASNPLPASVVFLGKNYGITPVRTTLTLKIGEQFTAEGHFPIPEFRDEYVERVNFTVEQTSNLVPVYFRPPIGTITVDKLPRDVELTLHGYFAYDQFNKRSASVAEVSYGKPLFVPYGRYEVELRCQRGVGPSGQFVPGICYRRELLLAQESPKLVISVTDEELAAFPVEIRSTPAEADVFLDAQRVGKTPYTGTIPVGEHTLILRKEGYLEATQTIKNDVNIPIQVDIPLKTTPAGGYLNEGRQFVLGGRYKEAIAKLNEVFAKGPSPLETAQAQYYLGAAFLGLSDIETAKGYFTQAQNHADVELKAKLGMARIAHQQGERTTALILLSDVMLRVRDDAVKTEAQATFREISPLRSVLYVYTDPPAASVYVNDILMKDPTPAFIPDLGLGNYRIRLEREGYLPKELNINLTVSEFNPVVVKLDPVPK
ncbi:MAG: PEGA domain-containing protein [Deltaproteobacteria bacterium]|nr:PEGA domain-containing protein [Deltaproteobacteria bacterium]